MKKLFFLALLSVVCHAKTFAQSITIDNRSSCTIYFVLFASNTGTCTNPLGPTSFISLTSGSSVSYSDPSVIVPGATASDIFTVFKIANANPTGPCYSGATDVTDCSTTSTITNMDKGCNACNPNPATIDWINNAGNITVHIH